MGSNFPFRNNKMFSKSTICQQESLSYSLPLFFLLFNPSFLSPSFPPSFSPLLPPSTYSLGIYSVTDSV